MEIGGDKRGAGDGRCWGPGALMGGRMRELIELLLAFGWVINAAFNDH